jgi:hypothetical protein
VRNQGDLRPHEREAPHSQIDALAKADDLKHTFEDESKIDVRQYLTKKHNLYLEAGETNVDMIVRRIYQKLDPALAANV